MKMFSKLLLAGAAAMLLGSTAQAAGTPVISDSGFAGVFTLTNLGSGSFTLSLSGTGSLLTVNGTGVSAPAAFDSTLAFTASTSGSDVTVVGGPYSKTFGTDPFAASLTYDLSSGVIGTGVNSNGLVLSGSILSVSPNALPGWDFSSLIGGIHTFALTGAFYTGGAASMADVFATAETSVTGTAVFSEAAPEPASMALLGIGLSGLFTVRRFLKRTVVA